MRNDSVYRFRRLKWGDPEKFKVLAEDLSPRRRPFAFALVVCAVFAATFALVYAI